MVISTKLIATSVSQLSVPVIPVAMTGIVLASQFATTSAGTPVASTGQSGTEGSGASGASTGPAGTEAAGTLG